MEPRLVDLVGFINHRVGKVEKGDSESPGPTSKFKQGHFRPAGLSPACTGYASWGAGPCICLYCISDGSFLPVSPPACQGPSKELHKACR